MYKPESCPPFEPKSSLLKRASSSYIGKLFKSNKKPTESASGKPTRSPYALRSKSNSAIQQSCMALNESLSSVESKNNSLRSTVVDVYQLGRMHAGGGNDFVIRGKLHEERVSELVEVHGDAAVCGPVSRYACRIECERFPPYKCFIYAGGYPKGSKVFDL